MGGEPVEDEDEAVFSEYGRCDTCGRECDEDGCKEDRTHVIALD